MKNDVATGSRDTSGCDSITSRNLKRCDTCQKQFCAKCCEKTKIYVYDVNPATLVKYLDGDVYIKMPIMIPLLRYICVSCLRSRSISQLEKEASIAWEKSGFSMDYHRKNWPFPEMCE